MKKIFVIIIMIFALLCFTGCGEQSKTEGVYIDEPVVIEKEVGIKLVDEPEGSYKLVLLISLSSTTDPSSDYNGTYMVYKEGFFYNKSFRGDSYGSMPKGFEVSSLIQYDKYFIVKFKAYGTYTFSNELVGYMIKD